MLEPSSLLAFALAAARAAPDVLQPETVRPWVEQMRPAALLLLFLMAVLAAVLGWQDYQRNRLVLHAIRRLELPPSAALVDQELSRLRGRDPAFSLDAFLGEARALFSRVQAARLEGRPPARHEVSDGVWRRAVVEQALERARGRRTLHFDATLREARVVGAFSDPHFDALHVRMVFTSRPAEAGASESAEAARARAGKAEALGAEAWVFLRRPTAKTLEGRAAGKCPNCGAPYEGGAANLCSHCKAILNSGSYGWVLAQTMDYEVYRGPWRQFTGFEEMVERDPGFSPEAIEDRAALLFWKWQHARAARDPRVAARLCAPEMAAELEQEAAALKARKALRWLADARVAGVDLLLLEHDDDEGRDQACVRVRWSGCVAEFPEHSPPRVPRASYATVLTLVRDSGATTDLATGVSSDRCHACKAASDDADSPACQYCGAPREPGAHDFVLRAASSFEQWMARRAEHGEVVEAVSPYVPAFKFADERLRLLQMMAALARADGEVSRGERALIKVCCRRWGVPFPEVREVLDGRAGAPELVLEPGSWPARAFLEALCEMAAIDGVIDSKERALLSRTAKHLGLPIPSLASLRARAEQAPRRARA